MKRSIYTASAYATLFAAVAGCSGSSDKGEAASAEVGTTEDALSRGNAQAHGPTAVGTRNWRADLVGIVEGPATMGDDGVAYVGNNQGILVAVDTGTGQKLWEVFVRGVVRGSPVIGPDGTVYVATDASGISAVDPATHHVKWSFNAGNVTASPVLADDGTLYVGNQAGIFFAVNPSGTQKWQFPTGGAIEAAATVGPDGTIYFGSFDNSVYALTPAGGQRWKKTLTADVRTTPAINGATVYVGSDANKLHALSASTGGITWEKAVTYAGVRTSPVVAANGNIITGAANSRVLGFSPSGTQLWTYTTGGAVNSSLVIDVDGRVYVGANDKKLHAINGNTGVGIFTYTASANVLSPALDIQGRVLFGTSDGWLHSLGKGKELVVGLDTTVSAGQVHANFGRDLQLKVGQEGGVDKRSLVGFPLAKLLGSVNKNMELVSAKLVLTKPVGGASSTTPIFVHSMNRSWTETGATWSCAVDNDPSLTAGQCNATDVWSMTGTTNLPYAATATTSGTLGSASQLTLDVTADFKVAMMQGELSEASWMLRSAGTAVAFGSAQSPTPPELVLSFQSVDPRAAREKKLRDRIAEITNPVMEGRGFWLGWAGICELWRAANGQSTNDMYIKLASDLDAADRADLQGRVAAIQEIPSDIAAGLLGPYAGIDPRSCSTAPVFDTFFDMFPGFDETVSARLRAPVCSAPAAAPNDDITVGVEVIRPVKFQLDGELDRPGKAAATARPVITGIDLGAYTPIDDPNVAYADFGHPALVEQWQQTRGGKNTPPGSNTLYPGDGLSPYGVLTAAPCNATSFANDTCDHNAGLVCDTLRQLRENTTPTDPAYVPKNRCVAYPTINREDGINLRGWNFWDREAKLTLTNVFDNNIARETNATGLQVNANPNIGMEALNCKLGNLNHPSGPSLFAVDVATHNTIQFAGLTDIASGFYRLKMYNRNGRFQTQADESHNRNEGRVIHVCRRDVETDPNQWDSTALSTRTNCNAPPASTVCSDGAVPCPPTVWARSLQECEPANTNVSPTFPTQCGETPSWFGSDEGKDVIVFLQGKPRPTYTYRTFVNRVECANETECDNCGGDDEFGLMTLVTTKRQALAAKDDPLAFRDKHFKTYSKNFESGQIRHPEKHVIEFPEVYRSDQFMGVMAFLEDDTNTEKATKITGGLVTGVAALVAGYYSAGAGAGVATIGVTITDAIVDATKKADVIGSRAWSGTYWDLMKRVEHTHQPDFMITDLNTQPKDRLKAFPKDEGGSKTLLLQDLIHPVVGYGRGLQDTVPECSTQTQGLLCAANTTCYVNQCIGTSEAIRNLTFPGPFRNPIDDPINGVGYRARYSFEGSKGRYKADLEHVLCPAVPQTPPELVPLRCRPLPPP